VQLEQALRQREADAEPWLCRAARQAGLHEHVEDARQRVRRDADAVVAHTNDDVVILPLCAERDFAARIGVLGRVVEEVGEYLREARGVALHDEGIARQRDGQAVVARLDERAAGLHRRGDDERKLDAVLPQLDLASRDA
jgi:hypothetical protein